MIVGGVVIVSVAGIGYAYYSYTQDTNFQRLKEQGVNTGFSTWLTYKVTGKV
jgi:hypothetical protein